MRPAPPIQRIWYPVEDPAQPLVYHEVGRDGVTAIVQVEENPEPYCHQTHFLVYVLDPSEANKEGRLKYRLDARRSGVEYK